MSEYITRERALEILNDIGGCGAEPESYTAGWDEAINAAYEAIQSEPAADVAPVVHGRWILERDPAGKPVCYHCSACDSDGSHTSIRIAYKYCPNCGAKMDGGAINDG